MDCSDGDANVAFVEAEAGGGSGRMDLPRMLVVDDAHTVAVFIGLVPEQDALVLPAHVLLLPTTRLGGTGLALGLSVHHAIADSFAIGEVHGRVGVGRMRWLAHDRIPYPAVLLS